MSNFTVASGETVNISAHFYYSHGKLVLYLPEDLNASSQRSTSLTFLSFSSKLVHTQRKPVKRPTYLSIFDLPSSSSSSEESFFRGICLKPFLHSDPVIFKLSYSR